MATSKLNPVMPDALRAFVSRGKLVQVLLLPTYQTDHVPQGEGSYSGVLLYFLCKGDIHVLACISKKVNLVNNFVW